MILWLQINRYVTFIKVDISEAFRTHFKGNFILFIPVIAVSLFKYMDKIMLGSMASNLELGYYDSVERLVNIPVAIVTALGLVMLPHITSLNQQGKESTGIRYMRYSLAVTAFLSFGLVFGMLAVIDTFVPLFFGAGYEKCITLSFFMIPTVVFLGLASVYRTQYLIPRKMDKAFIYSVFFGAAVNLLLNMLLIPSYKSIGAAIGTFFAELTVFLYQLLKVHKNEKILTSTFKSFVFAPAAVLMYGIMRVLPVLSTSFVTMIFKIAVGGFCYMLLSFAMFKCIFHIDIFEIKKKDIGR